jgi:hypothetical protein
MLTEVSMTSNSHDWAYYTLKALPSTNGIYHELTHLIAVPGLQFVSCESTTVASVVTGAACFIRPFHASVESVIVNASNVVPMLLT